jgi:hypothetical protein
VSVRPKLTVEFAPPAPASSKLTLIMIIVGLAAVGAYLLLRRRARLELN